MVSCQKIKIGIIIDSGNVGGVQKIAIEEVKILNKLGYFTKLLVMDKNSSLNINKHYSEYLFPKSLPKIKLYPFDFLTFNHLLCNINPMSILRLKAYDIVIAHNIIATILPLISQKLTGKPKKIVLYYHDTAYSIIQLYFGSFLIKGLVKILEKYIIKYCDLIIANSDLTAEIIKETYKFKPSVIYPGAKYKRTTKKDKKYDILFVTRWNKRRNLELIIKIAKKFPFYNVVMAGIWSSNNDKNTFVERIKKKKITNIIIIDKYLSENELIALYQVSKIYVQTEPVAFGMGALEAFMNCCLPIVWEKSGISYLFNKENLSEFIVSNERQLLERVDIFVRKFFRLSKEKEKIREILRKKYSWESHAKKILYEILSI